MSKAHSCLCIGLDPFPTFFSPSLKKTRYPLYVFNKRAIEATVSYAAAYKPNLAFYEAYGAEGMLQLKKTCDYLRAHYPEIPILLDAKRADIDSSNVGTARFAFEYLKVDGITLHPYLGGEALKPFLGRGDKLCIILCHTSNPGAEEFQELVVQRGKGDTLLYLEVAREVSEKWNENHNCMVVVGATYPKELAQVRKIIGEMMILVPGIGVQGGNIRQVLRYGQNKDGTGVLINVGRAILNARSKENMELQAKHFFDEITKFRLQNSEKVV